jgi:hypothetical protein
VVWIWPLVSSANDRAVRSDAAGSVYSGSAGNGMRLMVIWPANDRSPMGSDAAGPIDPGGADDSMRWLGQSEPTKRQ